MSRARLFLRTHLCLHHVGAVHPQVKHCPIEVHCVSGVQLLEKPVQGNEGSGAAHTSTAEGREENKTRLFSLSLTEDYIYIYI